MTARDGCEQLTTYTWSGSQSTWARTNVYGDGELLATYDPVGAGLHFHLTDHLGTRRVQTDAAGTPETDCQSLPYGDGLNCFAAPGAAATGASGDDATPLHFTGKERDTESGNDYFMARYYSSALGRFLSPDWDDSPVSIPSANPDDPQTLNLYAYVRNNPLSRTDPNGHGGPYQKLTNQSDIRVDVQSADQVNIHIKVGKQDIRGRLDPDNKQIIWTKGQPPKNIADAAQKYVLQKGKYDLAAAKKEMSVLGGTREAEAEGSKLGEAGNLAITVMNLFDIVAQGVDTGRINSLEGTTGIHAGIDGSLSVTNLQKFGDTVGVGAKVDIGGDTFKLNDAGSFVDSMGSILTQDKTGAFHVQGPSA